ncbi:MAG: hypothetical protein ACRCUS_06885 [Anaerovoracaceae bacterium]
MSRGGLGDGINQILRKNQENKLWEMYLAKLSSFEPIEVSFEDWKKEMLKETVVEEMTEVEIEKNVTLANNILEGFNPNE